MIHRKRQETDGYQQRHVSAVGRRFVESEDPMEDEDGGEKHGEAVG